MIYFGALPIMELSEDLPISKKRRLLKWIKESLSARMTAGFTLKEAVKEHLLKNGYDVTDVGTLSLDEPVVYYEVGRRVAKEVADKKFERGLLFCGTGMGVNLVANKFPGVYCGLCESVFAAKKVPDYQ